MKIKKILQVVGIVVFAISLILFSYLFIILPDVGKAPEIKIELTEARIERGRYLATSVSGCMDCHSSRDWSRFSAPVKQETYGAGNIDEFIRERGLPGNLYAPNITPEHLQDWSDGEIYRAITMGVSKDGRPLFPVMPYPRFREMDQEDIYSIIAFLRTLPAKKSEIPESELDFPLNLIVRTIPKPPAHQKRPDPSDEIAYGRYMLNAAACYDCHTPQEKGQYLDELAFAGGMMFPQPDGSLIRSANITPDTETGIGSWTREAFIKKFRDHDLQKGFLPQQISAGANQTMMPWTYYAKMKDEDLGAIFSYLKTLKPIKNAVVKFEPSTAAQKL